MPDWAVQLLVQFPIVGLVFVAVTYSTRYNDKRWREFFADFKAATESHRETVNEAIRRLDAVEARMDERYKAELERSRRDHDAHVRSLRAEIRRLENLLRQRTDQGGEDR